jgi:molecular chaperone DnaK
MGLSSVWGILSRNPKSALLRARQRLDKATRLNGISFSIGGEAWMFYQKALVLATRCGSDAVMRLVLDFDLKFPPGAAPSAPPLREAITILLASEPIPDQTLEAAHRLALRLNDAAQIRRVEHLTCLSLAKRGESDGLISKLLVRAKCGLLDRQEIEEVTSAYLSAYRFDGASPWAGFLEQLPHDQLPHIHQVHALLGRFHEAADIAEQCGDSRVAVRYLLQCPGTEAARRAVTLSEGRAYDPELAIKAHHHAGEAFFQERDYITAAEHFQKGNDPLRLSDCYLLMERISDAIKSRPEISPAWLATVREKADHMLRDFTQRGASLEAIRLISRTSEALRAKDGKEYLQGEAARFDEILNSLIRTARASLTEESRSAAPGAEVFRRWSAIEEAAGNFLEAGIQAEFAQDYVTATLMFEKAGAFGRALRAFERSPGSDHLERRAELLDRGGDFFMAGLIYERLGQTEKAIAMFEQAGEFARAADVLLGQLSDEKAALDDRYLKLAVNAGRAQDVAQLCWDFAGKGSTPDERVRFLRRIKFMVEQGYVGAAWSDRVEGEIAQIDSGRRSWFANRAAEWADTAAKDVLGAYVHVLGIDLGTSNTVVALYQKQLGQPEIVELEGKQMIPSIFAIDDAGREVVGVPTAGWLGRSPRALITEAKREMGSGKSYKADQHMYRPEEISARILQYAQQRAGEYLRRKIAERMTVLANGESRKGVPEEWIADHLREHPPVTVFVQAVITVPAHFNEAQKQATRVAAEIAGMKLLRLIHEPTAACLAQPPWKSQGEGVLVIDLGAGTLDLSLVQPGEGIYEVQEIVGDARLGSSDLDRVLFEHFHHEIKNACGHELDKLGQRRLIAACEELKIELSLRKSWAIDLPALVNNQPFHMELTRESLQRLAKPWLDRISATCRKVKAKPARLLLVGGGTLMPAVRDCVQNIYQLNPSSGVDPLTAVARGAAIQAAILAGAARNVVLLDVTPFSLGIKAYVGPDKFEFSKLIPRHTTIPTRRSEQYTTVKDNQTIIAIDVYQGESSDPSQNFKIGEFRLEGLLPAKAGVPQIHVTFDIDANCLLTVTARDNATGRECGISIADSHLFTPAQMGTMKERLHKNEQAEAVKGSLARIATSIAEKLENPMIAELPRLQTQLQDQVTELEQHFSRYAPTPSDNEVILDLYQRRDPLSIELRLLLDKWSSLQQSARSWIAEASHPQADGETSIEAGKQAVASGEGLLQRLETGIQTGAEIARQLRHWIAVLTGLPISPTGDPEDIIEHLLRHSCYEEAVAAWKGLGRPVNLRQVELGLEIFARRRDRDSYGTLISGHAELLGVEKPDFARLNQSVRIFADSVVLVQCETASGRSSGTGFAVGRREIATNRHVVSTSDGHLALPEKIAAMTSGGQCRISAVRVPRGTHDDVAILQLAEGEPDLRPLRMGFSDLVELGERILTIGFPTPRDSDHKENLYCNSGLVNRMIKSDLCSERVIEVSIELHGGISGAPILNEYGEVIGLLTFSLHWERVAEGGHRMTERSYYAIPVEILRRLGSQRELRSCCGPMQLKTWF